jgi:hypothetical protein
VHEPVGTRGQMGCRSTTTSNISTRQRRYSKLSCPPRPDHQEQIHPGQLRGPSFFWSERHASGCVRISERTLQTAGPPGSRPSMPAIRRRRESSRPGRSTASRQRGPGSREVASGSWSPEALNAGPRELPEAFSAPHKNPTVQVPDRPHEIPILRRSFHRPKGLCLMQLRNPLYQQWACQELVTPF